MNFRNTTIRFCKLPLVIAIGSVILAAVIAPHQYKVNAGESCPRAQNEAVSNVPATRGTAPLVR